MPTLRAFGDTRFPTLAASRTGNSGILAMDVIALMRGLGIKRFAVAGHDWSSNMAEALAVGWPEWVERIAMLSVYKAPVSPKDQAVIIDYLAETKGRQ